MLVNRIYTEGGGRGQFHQLRKGQRRKYLPSSAGAYGTGLWGSRGIFAGGSTGIMDYISIPTPSNALFFGDLAAGRGTARTYHAATSDGSRGINGGGHQGGPSVDVIDHYLFSTPSRSVDFGNLTLARQYIAATTNGSRGAFMSGAVIDYVTFATPGNATDWGNPVTTSNGNGGQTDGERGVWAISGQKCEYFNIGVPATNSTAFGNFSGTEQGSGAGNGSRATFCGGHVSASYRNAIEYITISTPAAAVDFGDDDAAGDNKGGTSDGSLAIRVSGAGNNEGITFFNISTLGNASKFGSLSLSRNLVRNATSGD